MIKHIVAWTFSDAPDGVAANAERTIELLTRCADLPGVRSFRLTRPQEGLEASFDLLLESEFDDLAALQAYVVHPLHKEAGAFIASVRTGRWAFDYEV